MWSACDICSAVVEDAALHAAWHNPPPPEETPDPGDPDEGTNPLPDEGAPTPDSQEDPDGD